MVSVSEAKAIIKKHAHFVRTGIKTLSESLGYTVAEQIISKYDIPGFRQSSMDGYALKFEDHNNRLEIVGEMRAGKQSDVTLLSGQAMRVFTGAPIPTAADTVVMQERVYREGDWITVADEQLTLGMHVREKGSEATKGTLALAQGTVLTPAALGFLAGIGCEKLLIFEPPKVAIIVTGDELKELGQPLFFGQVYDSNSIQLRAALQKAGIETVQVFHATDDPAALEKILGQALLASDLVLLVGGVSVGDYDFVVQSALAQSVRPHFHKVKQKPGKPLFFGTKDETVVFGLPGNPSSALTCFYLYVLPAIDRMMQRADSVCYSKAVTTVDYPKNSGLTHFIKAHLMDGRVLPLHAQESYRLQSYAQANCLLVIPEESTGIVAGEEVQVIVLL
ncbi:molybdopterin molybdotransferase MoeA [Sphingobacterium kitahiroshimense]|nr:molybdopterin molybdotransferase MoeA [Sphingobacterium sp. B16(2022)]